MNSGATEMYDAMAPHYREYSAQKAAYLGAVDRFVLDNIDRRAKRLLDVGAGDGLRGMSIAKAAGIETVVLSEPSPEMAGLCRQLEPAAVWQTTAEELPDTAEPFEVVLCLWNVLGHLQGRSSRLKALTRIRDLMSSDGMLFFDVNNRHNAAAYGWARCLSRVLYDAILPDDRRGDASFSWAVGGKKLSAMGHLFVSREIESTVRESGFRIARRVSVDYRTGRISNSILRGQLLYIAQKNR
jgi:2-polyprenyl-3-methyl-5-hydroxy-6-metoxy-1,4-benzoquinol methylase